MSNAEAHSPGERERVVRAPWACRRAASGVSHSPLVDTARASSRKAARQTGSRHEFDIIDPFHSSKILRWQLGALAGVVLRLPVLLVGGREHLRLAGQVGRGLRDPVGDVGRGSWSRDTNGDGASAVGDQGAALTIS